MTIRELALHVGLSKSTVAYALKDDPRISAAVRRRVQEEARRRGYFVHPFVRSFMRGVRRRDAASDRVGLAYLMSGRERRITHRGSYERETIAGARARARDLGYQLDVIAWEAEGLCAERLAGVLRARGIRGVYLGPATAPHSALPVDPAQFVVVAGGFTTEGDGVDRFSADLDEATRRAIRTALARGYRRVGVHLDPRSDDRVRNLWLAGALVQQRLSSARHVVIAREAFPPTELRRWVARARLAALIAGGAILTQLEASGACVPAELGFVALDHAGLPERVTAIVQPHRELGEAAISHLVAQVERGAWGRQSPAALGLIACGWREGETLPPR